MEEKDKEGKDIREKRFTDQEGEADVEERRGKEGRVGGQVRKR